jgi:alpha-ketoglutarate-dependent taurine dioxygenase
VLTGPPRGGGGDTLWSSQYAAYDQLSAPMQKYLEGLTAIHSAELQAQGSRDLGRTVRREPVTTEHPLIRTNPGKPFRRDNLINRSSDKRYSNWLEVTLLQPRLRDKDCRHPEDGERPHHFLS